MERHPELSLTYEKYIMETLAEPDQVRNDIRFEDTLLFSRWYPKLRKGRYIVVAVVTETVTNERTWIVTTYISRKITQGEVIWTKN